MAKKRKLRSSNPDPQEEAQPPTEQEPELADDQAQAVDAVPETMAVDEINQETIEEVEEEIEEEVEEVEEEVEQEGEEHNPTLENEVVAQPESNGAIGENGTELDDEPVDSLLEPFSKDQLVALLKKATGKYPDLIESVREIADADPAHRKIFVHGLGWDTTAETLKSEFGKYGEIEDCKAVTDRVSGKSKGYAFILFKHRSGAKKALKEPQKKIGNRTTSCQLASAGPVPAPPPTVSPMSEYTQRKIFVSNVSAEVDPTKLLEFFKQFGEVEDGPLGLDKQTGKPRGFALFVYKTIEGAKKALEEPHKIYEGVTLHCQRAIDGQKQNKPFGAGGGGSGHHHHHQNQPHYNRKDKNNKYSSGGGGPGHLMAPPGPAVGFNPGIPTQGITPAIGQVFSALLASQGAGMGFGNLLGGLGGAPVNQGIPPAGYGNQPSGGYVNQPGMHGVYQNQQMGPGNGRPPQGGGGPPYMGL